MVAVLCVLGKLFYNLGSAAGNEALQANDDLCRMDGYLLDVDEHSCWVFCLLGSKSVRYFGVWPFIHLNMIHAILNWIQYGIFSQ